MENNKEDKLLLDEKEKVDYETEINSRNINHVNVDVEEIDNSFEYNSFFGVIPVIFGLLTVVGVYQFLKSCINLETLAVLSILGVGLIILLIYCMPILSIASIVYLKDKLSSKHFNLILLFGIIISVGEGLSLFFDTTFLNYGVSEDKVPDIVKVISGIFLLISSVVQYIYFSKFIKEQQYESLSKKGIKNIDKGYLVNLKLEPNSYILYMILLLTSILGSFIYSYFFLYNEYLLKLIPLSGGLLLMLFFASIIGSLSISNLNKYEDSKFIDKISVLSIVITMIQFTTLIFYDGVDFNEVILTPPNIILQVIGGIMLFISLIIQSYFIDKIMKFRRLVKNKQLEK